MNYAQAVEEDIVFWAQNGDQEALEYIVSQYEHIVKMKIGHFFLIGASTEDVFQEGLIGLFKAIRDYDKKHKCSFKTFADLCVERQLISAVQSATRMKHTPLNSYISLDQPIMESDNNGNNLFRDICKDLQTQSPEEIIMRKEKLDEFNKQANELLTKLEKKILHLYLAGNSYQEIAGILHVSKKAVDNALQRIKRKTRNREK